MFAPLLPDIIFMTSQGAVNNSILWWLWCWV